ncbi:MFS transporter [Methylomonas sp. 2BW1-5-20]|uniref:MFS transporter n=1 Tax=Methylomonas sp. 2BW1-5-20 TaxID=3376686 RepID=UPI004051C158
MPSKAVIDKAVKPVLPRGWHYAWVVLAVTFLCLFVAAAMRALPGILMLGLEREFGWSRPEISGAVSVNLLVFGFSGPWLGRCMDLYGPKRICVASVVLLTLAAAACALIDQLWQFYCIWGLIAGIGSGGTSIVLGSAMINRWFQERRGLALGILGAAFSSGQLIFTPLAMQIDTDFGWRPALLVLAGLLGIVVLPLAALLLADEPGEKGLSAYGAKATELSRRADGESPMRDVAVQGQFWLLAISFGICGFTTSGLFQTHLIPHGIEHGFSEMTMALSLGVMGATDIVGTLLSGWLCDRFNHRKLLGFYYALRGVSLLGLPYVESSGQLLLFSVIYGLNWLSTVPVTSSLTADLFGGRNVGVVFGWICCAHQVGAAAAAYFAAYLHSVFSNYDLAFFCSGAFALMAVLIVGRIRE